ncbi:MAG: hypothetical protein JWO67_3252 [Streptosporangiaceae bacterium]|nr:hypothetical protein [Streptosporangiaceae bacterium]
MSDSDPSRPDGSSTRGQPIAIGLLAAPGPTCQLAERLARELPDLLEERFPGLSWRIEVRVESRAGPGGDSDDLIRVARRLLLIREWSLAICLTDLPLYVGRRPVTAHASVSLGVALVSVPALGVVGLEDRLRRTALRLIEGLLGGSVSGKPAGREGRVRLPDALREIRSPVGRAEREGDQAVRFVAPTTLGNVRLLAGMVRANRPWRVVVSLSRALVSALGIAAFALISPGVWQLANDMGVARLVGVAVGSVLAIGGSLIIGHGLWERSSGREWSEEARRRMLLFNLTTVITVLIGVLTLYLAQLAIAAASVLVLIPPQTLQSEIGRAIGLGNYLALAWLATSMAMAGGALGAVLEDNAAVREAAYGYRPEESVEIDDAEASV